MIKDIGDPGSFLDYKKISLTKLKVVISFFKRRPFMNTISAGAPHKPQLSPDENICLKRKFCKR